MVSVYCEENHVVLAFFFFGLESSFEATHKIIYDSKQVNNQNALSYV